MKDYITRKERMDFPNELAEGICLVICCLAIVGLIYIYIYEVTL